MIVAGFGFRQAARAESLEGALRLSGHASEVRVLATATDKAAAPVFCAFGQRLGLPVKAIDSAALAAQDTVTRSAASLAARGTGSLAEAAALAAAGPGARLVGPRVVSADGMATCALARTKGDST